MEKATRNIIMVRYGGVRKLAKVFGVSEAYVSKSLRGHAGGDRARKIRHVALTQFEGVEMEPAVNLNNPDVMKRLEPRTYTKIFFEDNGQDFLYWIIDDQGRVVSAGPWQNELWKDNVVDLDSLEPGKPLFFTFKLNGEYLELKHKVEKVVTGPLAIFE